MIIIIVARRRQCIRSGGVCPCCAAVARITVRRGAMVFGAPLCLALSHTGGKLTHVRCDFFGEEGEEATAFFFLLFPVLSFCFIFLFKFII